MKYLSPILLYPRDKIITAEVICQFQLHPDENLSMYDPSGESDSGESECVESTQFVPVHSGVKVCFFILCLHIVIHFWHSIKNNQQINPHYTCIII